MRSAEEPARNALRNRRAAGTSGMDSGSNPLHGFESGTPQQLPFLAWPGGQKSPELSLVLASTSTPATSPFTWCSSHPDRKISTPTTVNALAIRIVVPT
jgi:hypothetical protein